MKNTIAFLIILILVQSNYSVSKLDSECPKNGTDRREGCI